MDRFQWPYEAYHGQLWKAREKIVGDMVDVSFLFADSRQCLRYPENNKCSIVMQGDRGDTSTVSGRGVVGKF